jgi:hypothetical protein
MNLHRTDLQIKSPNNASLPNEFNISQPAVRGLIWYLNRAFDDGSMWAKIPDPKTRVINSKQLMPNVTGLVRLVPGTQTFEFLPEIMQVFWTARDTGINTIFENVATSLTNNIRMTADHNTSVPGQEAVLTTVIEIRWPWIGLPCATILMATLFLVIAMAETCRTHTPLWKGSELATLFHGFSDELRKNAPQHTLQSQMKRNSRGIFAKLAPTEKGLMLGSFAPLLSLEFVCTNLFIRRWHGLDL